MSLIEEDRVLHSTIIVRADWDEEAGVWVASCNDVHGLSVEAATLEALEQKVFGALQDLIELNGLHYAAPKIPVQIMAQHLSHIPNPTRN